MNNKVNILYTCDNAYLPLTSISMASVIANNQSSDICFYIATETEDNDNFKYLLNFYKDKTNIEIKYLDAKKYDNLLNKNNLDKWGSNSYYVYWKLFAYDNLDVDYIWYLDSDVLCLSKINNPKLMENKSVGGTLDTAHYTFNKVAHINENYYFYNTGALFVDVKKWKDNGNTSKVINYIENLKYKPLMCDQDFLAIALQEDIEVLNPKYNYLIGYDYYGVHNVFEMYSLNKKPFYKEKEIEDAKDEVIFYHYLGGVFGRPWQKGNYCPRKEEFNKYRELSAWPKFESKFNKSILFRFEGALEFLPKTIYNKIHNFAMTKYLERLGKQ